VKYADQERLDNLKVHDGSPKTSTTETTDQSRINQSRRFLFHRTSQKINQPDYRSLETSRISNGS